MSVSIPNILNLVDIVPTTIPSYSGSPDWVSITGAVTNEILLLVNDATNGQYTINTTFTRPSFENIYIDWGDGSPLDTISTTTSTNNTHTYTTGGTASSRGYNTWKVRIYGDAGTRITKAQIVRNTTDPTIYPCGLIQAWYGDNTVTTMQGYFRNGSSAPNMPYLEYVRVPEGLTATDSLNLTFGDCTALQKVDLPNDLSAITNLAQTFQSCNSLYELSEFPANMTGVTTTASMFENCYAIPRIVFRNTFTLLTTMNRTFSFCYSLGEVILPPTPSVTNYDLTYNNCSSIRSISLPKIPNTTLAFGSTFINCTRLQNIFLDPTTTAGFGISFNGCSQLKIVNLPPNSRIFNYSGMFAGCSSLIEVTLTNDATNTTNFSSIFSGCFSLQKVRLPQIPPTAPVSFANAFQDCRSLTEITIPSGYVILSMASCFNGCRVLQNVSIPNIASYSDMSNTFANCFMLEYVTLPTNLSNVTTISGMFQGSSALKEVIFPSSMNSVTTSSNLFSGCVSLQKAILPTSMTSLGGSPGNLSFVNMFQGCKSLQTLVLPQTTSSASVVTTMNSFALNCTALKSISLPTTPTTALITAILGFANCPTLTGITNIEYFGNSGNTTTNYVNGTTLTSGSPNLLSLDFRCKFSKLELNGTDTGINFSKLQSLRLRNNGAGQYAGTSPHINISFTNLSQAALVQVFNDLPTVTAKTINITSATGAAALTVGERAIATGKGWTIVG